MDSESKEYNVVYERPSKLSLLTHLKFRIDCYQARSKLCINVKKAEVDNKLNSTFC